ncbi:putative transmembrane protein [Nocardia nova SH22a]|uniref:Putative transmembrane protein n=1 Tax=Nocardia nova SH22a TaxID=1415166 RepID=W5TKX3_9NOCA|nr:ABC transporter permease [Nocardia nova]AHH19819.1 putative transmembrane protein [Nocardia nova SH22a]
MNDLAPNRPAPRPIGFRWITPVVVVTVFASLLGLMYLAYVAKPDQNLHNFPIAVVNNDVGDTIGGQRADYGSQVLDAVTTHTPSDRFDLRVVGLNEAQRLMQDGKVYGALIIPADFTKRLGNLGAGSVLPGELPRPTITMETNPRLGPFSTSVSTRFANQTLEAVNNALGPQLTERVQQQLGATQLSASARLTLGDPVQPVVEPYHGMPAGSGQGLTAFFFALTILLGGMTGAMTVHALIDSLLGFAPTEFGPYFSHAPAAPISRLRTLMIKWGTMAAAAALSSGALIGIATALGVHMDQPLGLFLYGTFAMTAVGVTALTIMAAVGSAGVLINLILFVILGMPSAGGTIPIEATPRFFARLADFEPMRQVYLAVRSLMFFDGSAAAGLERGVWMTVAGSAIGIVSGVVVTAVYDKRGLTRTSRVPVLQPA